MNTTENTKTTTVSFVSLGCFKNVVDTEVLGGMLEKRNIRLVSEYEDSEWVVINTCGFIRDAKEESIDEILAALEKKEVGEIKHVAVFGCLTQRYYEELKENFKEADIVWGVNDLEQLADIIAGIDGDNKDGAGEQDVVPERRYRDTELFLYNHEHKRIITTTPNVTFIKISEGCNMKCSFCAIPQIRGEYRSRTIESIVMEAEKYKSMGFQEINLISQNSTYFGKDRGKKSELPQLLRELSRLKFEAVRVLYLMPEEVTDEIIDAYSFQSIVPYFDLPFQHVSKTVLKGMNRGGGVAENMELIRKIRKKYKKAVIRSSFIVGYPTEKEEHFKELMDFAEKAEIERIGVFGYSPEEGTEAFDKFKQDDVLPPEEIDARREKIMDISDKNIEKYNAKIEGSTQKFLPLGPCPWEPEATIGRIMSQGPDTDGMTVVEETFEDDFSMYKIRITGFQNELLYGERV